MGSKLHPPWVTGRLSRPVASYASVARHQANDTGRWRTDPVSQAGV